MRIKVIKPLNTRIGGPSRTFQKGITRVPGEEMEMVSIVKGEEIDTNDDWYMQDNVGGNYYWSGGVMASEPVSSLAEIKRRWQFDENKMSWAHDDSEKGGLGIISLWNEMKVKGEGINVVILDTGISDNKTDFIDGNSVSTIKGTDFIKGINGINNTIDINDHGTNNAAIIAATGKQKVYGVAPGVNLYIIKIGANLFASIENVIKGLQLISSNKWKPDIISISFCFPQDNSDLATLITSSFPDTLIISSLDHPNQSTTDFKIEPNQFPAFYDNVIAVTAIDKNKNILSPCNFVDNKICWAFPGENILTLNSAGDKTLANQTSIATPIGAGIFALYMSYLKNNGIEITGKNISNLKNLLLDNNTRPLTVQKNGQASTINICVCNPLAVFKQVSDFFQIK